MRAPHPRLRLAVAAAIACSLVAVAVAAGPGLTRPASAVVGGEESEPGAWPWQVAVLEHGDVVCGGALLGDDVVVTAAHCTDGVDRDDLDVIAGTVRLHDGGERRTVARIDQHEGYDPFTTRNDIALLTLASPLELDETVQPAAVPGRATSAELLEDGDRVVVTGFGSTTEDGAPSPRLREAEVGVLDDATCTTRYGEDGDEVFGATQVCAGEDRGQVDACFGDSGGPLVANAGDEADEASWFLVGVVSWGAGCGRALRPTVYTEVAAFSGWLAEHGGLGRVGGERFASDEPLWFPVAGLSEGKASRYPSTVQVQGVDGPVRADGVAVELRGLAHERLPDLDVWLEAPDGTVVTLLSDVGGEEPVTGLDVVIDAGGPRAGGSAIPVRLSPSDREADAQPKGSRPPASFEALDGVDADGEWRLLVADDRDGATGRLAGWALVLTGGAAG